MDNKGVVLLSALIILLTISIIGASLVSFFSSVELSARNVADEAKALYLAEAGISHAIYLLRTQAGQTQAAGESIGPIRLGEGSFIVNIDPPQSMITSKGSVNGAEKTVQLQYSAL